MWFKNLCVLQINDPFELAPEMLHENLLENAARKCGPLETSTFGWTTPLGKDGNMLVHAAMGYNMLTARKEVKLLPSSVIRHFAGERIHEIEQAQNRKVGARERAKIREEITMELLPRAFHRIQDLYGYIDIKNQLIIIDTSNIKKADSFLELLRLSLGSFNITWPTVKKSPNHVMSEWLMNREVPQGFTLDDVCELINRKGDGSIVKCVKQDMTSDEIVEHLKAGKQVTQLALTWEDRISFVLSDNLMIKRLRFLDLIMSEARDAQAESAVERFDADFAIMTSAVSGLLTAVFDLFGGLGDAEPQSVEPVEELAAA